MAYYLQHILTEASTSGLWDSPGPPPLGNALSYVLAHRQSQRNVKQIWYFFVLFFGIQTCFLSGAIQPKYMPDGGVQWLCMKP
jgi:hypothetical protein